MVSGLELQFLEWVFCSGNIQYYPRGIQALSQRQTSIVSDDCNVGHAEDNIIMDLSCKVILLEWLLTVLLKHVKG